VCAAVGAAVDSALDAAVGDDEGERDEARRLLNREVRQSGDSRGMAVSGDSDAGGSEAAVSVAKQLIFLE
jgi:hypothetical protein